MLKQCVCSTYGIEILNISLYTGVLGLMLHLGWLLWLMMLGVVVVGFLQHLSGVAVRVRLSGAHQVDILLCYEAERGELCAVTQGGRGGGGGVGGGHSTLSLGGG